HIDNPGVIAPPPLIFAGPLAIGLLLQRFFPKKFLPRWIGITLGGMSIISGVMLIRGGFREMLSAKTNVNPTLPSTTIVTEGPYRYTRNPLYLGLTLMYAGITFLANAFWAILLLPVVLVVMVYGVIKREEQYLERKFGEQYLNYKARVRRWL
ncbi:MAG TPA: isoprenylcysteine carboxylmethyltransferase family protein, partial [Ktedonobacteraceae bacterium]|nr:isoprenylcysteine carboxylmethyltransferase family protein [Ktedonobacteraceae bacterium]